ncbi:hypothetical protein IWQ61_010308, partial [Dispira simplex]
MVGFKELGKYGNIANVVEELIQLTKDLVLEEVGRDANDIAIQRRILPHLECDVRCDSDANIRYDIVLHCCGSEADVKQEYKPFESKLNLSNGASRCRKKCKVDKQNNAEEDDDDKFQEWIKEAFGIIEVKSSPKDDDLQHWKVECFDSNRNKNQQGGRSPCAHVYVDPKPITSSGSLFGRRTHCYHASLTEEAELNFILKESWTEVDGKINKVEEPNEVRIFNHIASVDRESNKKPLTENGVPKMKYGGTVCIKKEHVHENMHQTSEWCYDTMSLYCGGLKVESDGGSNRNPLTSQGKSVNPRNVEEPRKCVECVHQRLVLTPVGKPMTRLHPYGTQLESEVPIILPPEKEMELYTNVGYFFKALFMIIRKLHKYYEIYHRDLSEGNVLVVKKESPYMTEPNETVIVLEPLLIDFDHARLKGDNAVDQMQSRTGTLPFMSILNLAGKTSALTFLDECESFLYLFLWKCIIGFARCQISLPATRKPKKSTTSKDTVALANPKPLSQNVAGGTGENIALYPAEHQEAQSLRDVAYHSKFQKKEVHQWASNEPIGCIEEWKRLHMHSGDTFSTVLKELRPEFKRLRTLFQRLRDALFKWEGGSGALVTRMRKTTVEAR